MNGPAVANILTSSTGTRKRVLYQHENNVIYKTRNLFTVIVEPHCRNV